MNTHRAATLRTPQQLAEARLIKDCDVEGLRRVAEAFSVGISPPIQRLIDPDDPKDPIAMQFVPSALEMNWAPEELVDPIGDTAHSPAPGIVHRYPDRVLFKPVSACAVYCRFCFRRETVGKGFDRLDDAAIEKALDYIDSTSQVWEVVVSGGDPLILSPRRLRRIMRRLDSIKHVGVVRFHTRLPVARPDSIDNDLIDAIKVKKAVYIVLHTNHVRELSKEARAACAKLIDSGIPMLSQTVLLKGVNADVESLTALFKGLVEMRIKPYYLHHGDLARGTAHFRTSIAAGQELMRAMRGTISGLCQPLYVLDIPGGHGKVPIGPNYLRQIGDHHFEVCDVNGRSHVYRECST
jgi:lysine 2,3-aminomutase